MMRQLLWLGAGAAILIGSASVSFAGPNVGEPPLSTTGRRQAEERRMDAQPYALTGDHWTWENHPERDPAHRNPGIDLKRVPANNN